jgi:hypothetical protein
MADPTWSEMIEASAKKIDIAIMFNAEITYRGNDHEWLRSTLRTMALRLDQEALDRSRRADETARSRLQLLASVCLFGLKFTVSRDG